MSKHNKIDYDFEKGQIIGTLTILSDSPVKFGHRYTYRVKCNNCGREYNKDAYNLKKEQGCKCIWKENNTTFSGYKVISGSYFSSIKAGAKARNIKFDLTIEEVWNQLEHQDFRCALSGVQIYRSALTKDKWSNTASLDRKLSDEGYNVHNIQWVHKDVNKMKNSYSDSYFVNMCKTIAKHNEGIF